MVLLATLTPAVVTAVTLIEYCTPELRSSSVTNEDVVFINTVEV